MTWQIWITLYMVLSTVYALSYRKFAASDGGSTASNNLLMYGMSIAPGGVIFGLLLGGLSFDFGLVTWLQVALGGVLFASSTNLSYIANKGVDAAKIGVIGNLASVVGIALASLLLSETLNSKQLLGVCLVMLSVAGVALLKRTANSTPARTAHLAAAVGSPYLWASH